MHLYEIALHRDYNPRDFHPPYALESDLSTADSNIGVAYIDAIMKCISSAQKLLDEFLSIDQTMLSAVPSIIFVRMTYAGVILFKIFLLATSKDHALASVLDQEQLHLPDYLGKLHSILVTLAHSQSFHGANKFLDIILRLESSYRNRAVCLRPAYPQYPTDAEQHNGSIPRNIPSQVTDFANGDWDLGSSSTMLPELAGVSHDAMNLSSNSTFGVQHVNAATPGESLEDYILPFEFQDVNLFMRDIQSQG